MRVIACIPVRNESWVLRASIPAALKWCDAVVVMDHRSDEGTHTELVAGRVNRGWEMVHLFEGDPEWREAEYRQRLLGQARGMGATHVVTIDADEILTENAIPRIRDDIAQLRPGEVLRVPWLQLWGSLDKYRAGDNSVWSSATVPLAFHAEGCDYSRGDYDIHERVPLRLTPKEVWPRSMGVMHLQHVNRRRLVAKQVLYMMVEVVRWNTPPAQLTARYGKTLDEKGMNLAAVPPDWWGPEKSAITPEAEPWQEGEVKRLLAEHGRERFSGIDLHGF
jgi:hypothetical protein